jgi:D-glycero-alpha-D-manno-heptose-7-phosphate kinase
MLKKILENEHIEASAPCRIDMGGTLDISTFYYPLRHLNPCTVNMAVDLRTRVCLQPYKKGFVKVSSKGFKPARFPIDKAPFDHPLGLMFAVAAYFRADGVHIDIESESPPRSALGGSSAAAVALTAALLKVSKFATPKAFSRQAIAWLAHAIEAGVAGVPCGFQDQLAAVYGGVNLWLWLGNYRQPFFKRRVIIKKRYSSDLQKQLLLAYCGVPHESKNINSQWVQQFLSGKYRGLWAEIIVCTQKFAEALMEHNIKDACAWMSKETAIRRRMTPMVLDETGTALVESAAENRCGARFTGAGGGGCLWALGEAEDIDKLKKTWEIILSTRAEACLLDTKIDTQGLLMRPL